MKKTIVSVIISLIITFIFVDIFSIYNFGDIPTLLTLFYLIAIFSIFEYSLLSIIYFTKKIIKKEKINRKQIVGRTLLLVALILILSFIIILDIDWINWYVNSSPFYINVIKRCFQFLLPSILFITIGIFLLKKNN